MAHGRLGPHLGRKKSPRGTAGATLSVMGLIAFPLLVAILGVLMYALSANPKLVKIGFALFVIGAAVCTLMVAPEVVRLIGGR